MRPAIVQNCLFKNCFSDKLGAICVILIALFLSAIILQPYFAQDKDSSIKAKYLKAEESLNQKDYNSAIRICDEIIALPKEAASKALYFQIKAYYEKLFTDFTSFDESRIKLNEKINAFTQLNDQKLPKEKHEEISAIKEKISNLQDAEKYLTEANAFLKNKEFQKADSSYIISILANPDNFMGYYALGLSKSFQDKDIKKGNGRAPFEKVISVLEKDSTALKERNKLVALLYSYQYIASYYAQTQDLKSAGLYWDKVEKINPSNSGLKAFRESTKPKEGQ